ARQASRAVAQAGPGRPQSPAAVRGGGWAWARSPAGRDCETGVNRRRTPGKRRFLANRPEALARRLLAERLPLCRQSEQGQRGHRAPACALSPPRLPPSEGGACSVKGGGARLAWDRQRGERLESGGGAWAPKAAFPLVPLRGRPAPSRLSPSFPPLPWRRPASFIPPWATRKLARTRSTSGAATSCRAKKVRPRPPSRSAGARRVTNKAALWYVPLSLKNVDKVLEVPPLAYTRKEQEEEGRKRYEAQKLERMETKWKNGDVMQPSINPEPYTVSYSQSTLIHLVGPSDCTLHGFVHGGVTMKLMDEVAGIVAARHCKTNIVTASVDAINFHDKIRKGCVITISGRMTFTSNKSMEIEVLVDADPVALHSQERYRAASAFVTYVSLSKEGKTLPVPQLLVETEEEKKRFEEGKGRYLQMKAKRQAQIDAIPQQQ
uniref:Acyl-CoA thioesterase 7 n=1 Tax=Sarcophilus harrisii TaxID=9305 RepID=A0A7N4PH54_SARHA